MENGEASFYVQNQKPFKIMLIEKKKISAKGELSIEFEEVISDDFDTAKTFNKFFVNIVTYLPRDISRRKFWN